MSWPGALGVATSAVRYWEELGLLPTIVRIAGQHRYPESAVGLVGIILLLRDVGFSLAEQKAFMASRGPEAAPASGPGPAARVIRPARDAVTRSRLTMGLRTAAASTRGLRIRTGSN